MQTFYIETADSQGFIVVADTEEQAREYVGRETSSAIVVMRKMDSPEIRCLGRMED